MEISKTQQLSRNTSRKCNWQNLHYHIDQQN